MKPWLVEYLACPVSGAPLTLRDPVCDDGDIIRGSLVTAAGETYPIIRGVPDLSLQPVSSAEAQTVNAFGEQWDEFACHDGYMASRELFFSFFPTLTPPDFAGRVVLEAGCGNGRWLARMSEMQAKHVIGLDYSSSVHHSHHYTRHLPNVSVVRGSILQPPLQRAAFDLIVSMGVIHHLSDPRLGMEQLGKLLTPQNGRIAIWVYAHEGNEIYLRLVTPLRRLGPRLPVRVLKTLSRTLAVPVWVHAHTLNRCIGVRADGTARLPLGGYFDLLRKLRFQDIVNVVHDQLTPQLARYYQRVEAESLYTTAGLELHRCARPRGNSYSLIGSPATSQQGRRAA